MTGLSIEDRRRLEDIGFMTCMTLVLLGNYAQTGHFGGPLAYTPLNVAAHLAGPERGGLRYDYRRPKHPFGDKFILEGNVFQIFAHVTRSSLGYPYAQAFGLLSVSFRTPEAHHDPL